jgi:hypothetical protein
MHFTRFQLGHVVTTAEEFFELRHVKTVRQSAGNRTLLREAKAAVEEAISIEDRRADQRVYGSGRRYTVSRMAA